MTSPSIAFQSQMSSDCQWRYLDLSSACSVPRMLFSCAGCDAESDWGIGTKDGEICSNSGVWPVCPQTWQTYPYSRGTHHCPGYGVCHSAAVGGHRERPDGIGLRVQPTGHASAPPPPPPRCGALTVCTEWLWSSLRWRRDEVRCPLGAGQWNHYPIILFFGINQGKVVPNPLQGPKLQMFTTGRKPCLNMCPTSNGYIWCSCGDSLELLDIVSLKSLRKLDALVVAIGGSETPRGLRKGEVMVIMLMATNALGVWTVTRRSTLLRLWDAVTGAMKASYNVRWMWWCVLCMYMYSVFNKLTNEANGTLGN